MGVLVVTKLAADICTSRVFSWMFDFCATNVAAYNVGVAVNNLSAN
jgi:hypothetical protein